MALQPTEIVNPVPTVDAPRVVDVVAVPPTGSPPTNVRPARVWTKDIAIGLCLLWLILVVAGAVLAPWLPIDSPERAFPADRLQGPSAEHWLGTDNLGRDLFSRIVYGARVSLIVGVGSVLLGSVVGTVIGVVAGFFRGWIDAVLSWVVDVVMSFPALVLLIALVAFSGGGTLDITLAMGLLSVPVFARLSRVHTMAVSGEDFVLAAKAGGSGRGRILWREIRPNVVPATLSYGLVALSIAIVTEGSLSFLGLSVSVPTPSWGGLIASGQDFVKDSAIGVIAPSLALCLTVLSLNVLGERLRRRVETGGS